MARPLDPSGLPVKKKGEKYVVHVISGTHWDREWRFTAEQSKFRLADLLDTVADTLERVPAYRQFVLDGGSVMLEDYLTIRPGSRERLARLVREGRLALTSWYTLPGINLVAPEAVIRNLQEGRRIADEFGGAMRTGYTATGYGQPSQMPQIYRGFGMEQVTLYRGTNKHAVPPVCRWTGRDGSEVLLIRGFDEVTRSNWVYYAYMPIALGKSGDPVEELEYRYDPRTRPVHMADAQLYEMGFTSLGGEVRVPRSRRALLQGYEHFRGQAYPYAIGKLVLALNMDDNASPWPNQPKLIEALNQVLDDTVILDSTLDDYVQAVVEEVKGTRLREVRGELRYPAVEYGWNGLFGMTASARVRMKQLNEEAETELILVAEPLAVVASLCGAPYPRVSLDAAWLSLLKNHAHDSICGASLDDVHEDMAYRFRHTRTVSEEVSRRSIEAVWNRIDHSGFQADDQTLTVFNSLPYARAGVHPFVLDLPADVFRNETYRHTPLGYPDPDLFDVLDEQGRPVDYEITDIQDIQIGYESPAESPGAYLKVKRHRVLLPVSLPSSGYRSFAVRKRPPRYVPRPRPRPPRPNIAHPGGILENRFLRVEIRANGAFDLTDRMRGRVFPNLHSFDDRISTMRYAHMEPPAFGDEAVTSLGAQAQITMLESNPLRGRYRIELTMLVPREARGSWYRSNDRVSMPITVELTLREDARRLEIRTRVDNPARDHRLLVLFPTGIRTDAADVETAFAVERRNFLPADIGDNSECDYVYQPMQNFLDLSDQTSGFALLNKGMREYAVWDDPARTVSLTLFRTYRVYMTANTDLTPEEEAKYPGTNCLGKMEFRYAVYPHAGDWREGNVFHEAYDFKTPIRAIQGPAKRGDLPAHRSFLSVQPAEKILFSALRPSADGQGWILRLCNLEDTPLTARVRFGFPCRSVHKIRMDERGEAEALTLQRRAATVPMRAAEIVTLRLDAPAAGNPAPSRRRRSVTRPGRSPKSR